MDLFYVYILASRHGTLYVRVTSDLRRRIAEHREGLVAGFTRRYNAHRLVYFESAADAMSAIAREKELKGWRKAKKTALVGAVNPGWRDLSGEWE
jgi:putative endonuclease